MTCVHLLGVGTVDTVNPLVVLGATASGKTRLAVEIALDTNAEILSVDSRQVYRGLDIGSGKDLDEYRCGDRTVPYHLIDIVDLDTEFSVFDFQKSFFDEFASLRDRGVPAIAAGGSGLYLEAALATPDDGTDCDCGCLEDGR